MSTGQGTLRRYEADLANAKVESATRNTHLTRISRRPYTRSGLERNCCGHSRGPEAERLGDLRGRSSVWQERIAEAVTLFVVIDPIGSTCIFLALAANKTPAERRRIALKSVVVSAGILIAFMIVGRILLDAM